MKGGFLARGWNCSKVFIAVSSDVASAIDAESLSTRLARTLSRAFGSESVSLFLADETKQSYVLRARAGWNPEPSQESLLRFDDRLVQALAESSHPIARKDPEGSSGQQEKNVVTEEIARSGVILSLPLRWRGQLTGVINLTLRQCHTTFSPDDLAFFSALANQVAVGLENLRLYDSLRQAQNIIQQAERLSSVGHLTTAFAHEIRNTLVAIRTFTQLLPERYTDPQFRDNFQSLALKEVDRICGLVNDLLSFARPAAPNASQEDINEIVGDIARILKTQAKEKGVVILQNLSKDHPKIVVDKEQIRQVAMNVILNAIQSIEGKGWIEISTCLVPGNGFKEFVQIAVQDSGVGIPERDFENIFNAFFTTKEGGSGLGLSISHKIVREHGGHILVKSEVGKGTTFLINLPSEEKVVPGGRPSLDAGGLPSDSDPRSKQTL